MASKIIALPPYNAKTPLTDENGRLLVEAHQSLLTLYNSHPLETVDTSGGPANFPVPIARFNQNVEITFVKISADGNVPTLVPLNPTDKINGGASLAMGTAQFSKVKLKCDGVSNWYVVG
jgi:hypothetical protein